MSCGQSVPAVFCLGAVCHFSADVRECCWARGSFVQGLGAGRDDCADVAHFCRSRLPARHTGFRNRTHPAAVLEMRFLASKNGGTSPVLQKDYTGNIPLQARTAAALVAGWNEALKQITTEAARDLNQAMQD